MTKKTPKISPARRELLEMFKDGRIHSGVAWYPPIKWALEHGYIEKIEQRFSDGYRITQAGRDFQASLPPFAA